ncbi:hypothetical protein FRC02_004252 [Tulasnella sp. 418]|nr:hypothetical protein FRC02_004252 [Tulasnella sp. 418]
MYVFSTETRYQGWFFNYDSKKLLTSDLCFQMSFNAGLDNLVLERHALEEAIRAKDQDALRKADRDLSMAIHSMGNVSSDCRARRNLRILAVIYQRASRSTRDKVLGIVDSTVLAHRTNTSSVMEAIIEHLEPEVVCKKLGLQLEIETVKGYEHRRPSSDAHSNKDANGNGGASSEPIDTTWVKVFHQDGVVSIWKQIGGDEVGLPDEVIHYQANQATPLDKNQGAFAPAYMWKDISQLQSGGVSSKKSQATEPGVFVLEDACNVS